MKSINLAGVEWRDKYKLYTRMENVLVRMPGALHQKLVNVDDVKYIVGGGCSGESLAIIPIINSAKVFTISAISSAPKLSGASPLFHEE